ncbi:YqeG family HAD IIIA-type phosphatase [Prochlorococcus marinus]|uniref:Predicted hydrolase of the HAD superfamily n=1 Tax=Prochlorococcus marinus (strain MIT 9211) TaxID=93059 RepID=A9BAP1_PROM4|nr:YqeG family HAD IIIA-type phosphatase [Prochlorococcus marinus]ABX08903.1 Predicted hydrolase of the HAD superfamily [Prochlorococcus marinus str. MIT 9211]
MVNYWPKPNWNSEIIITRISPKEISDRDIKVLLLDVDGTLIGGKETKIDQSVIDWVDEAKKYFHLHLVSNNPSKERIKTIAQQIDIDFTYGALKPRRSSILKVIKNLEVTRRSIGIVGDRLFTDILAGNRLGIYTILVKPMGNKGEMSKDTNLQNLEMKIAKVFGKIIS